MDHAIKFVFETLTDLAFVPALGIVAMRGRHFELFVGLLQILTSIAYNLCDALSVELFLTKTEFVRPVYTLILQQLHSKSTTPASKIKKIDFE